MQRSTILITAAAALVAITAFLTWRHVSLLDDRLAALSKQVGDLGDQAAAADRRATEAETQAAEAQERADAARREAGEADRRAEEATALEQQSTAKARQAEAARDEAARRERQATEEKEQAELLAQASAADQAQAVKREIAAEVARAEAQRKAQTARDEAGRARAETEEMRRRMEAELDRMQRALSRIAETRRTALGLVMTLDSSKLEFDTDKADLRPQNREVLSRTVGVLLTFENYGVQVFGHTDDVASEAYNQELSERRAEAVRGYLVEAGIDEAAVSTMGLGKSSPLVEGTDPKSRQRNRRVELAIVFSDAGDFEVAPPEQ